ncbi:MAG: glycoside hydrolase family 11 protein, partial [Paludibacteraceae bacterium]|nr:glycoside hydrolase family 11 protein [Paludibacteraceae bacterium]
QGGGEQQGGGSTSNCVDPCSYKTKYSGGTNITSNGVKDVGNGYNVEMWRDGNSGGMTVFGGKADCAFKANWNNSGDYLARVGYYDGSAKKKYTDLGEIYAVYNYSKSGNGGGSYSYIGIYGWTKNPLIEYYIVDDSFTPNGGGMFWGANNKGTYTVDGVTYTLKVGQRTNAPSIEGDGKNFQQIFAVRSSYQTCGTINVTEHFKNWERLGVKLGGIYDCKILCEVGGGSGSIEYTCASMSWKGQNSSLGDLSCSEGGSQGGGEQGGGSTIVEQKPYKSAISIPGTLEGEHYDIGGNGNAYKDSDDENEGDAKFRTDEGVDIVKGGTGMAIGYTTSSEWLEYTVKVEKTAKYDLTANASNGGGEINFDLYIDDAKVATVSGSKTDSWDTYTALEATTTKEIKAGEHILKIKFESSNNNIDYIKFVEHDDSQQGGGEQGGGQGSHGGHGGTYIPAGEYPISYDVENTGAACTDPVSLNKNNLKSCKTLPNPFEWADGSGKVTDFCDWSCRRNEIKREIEYWEIGEKPKFDKLEASYSG